MVVFDGKVKVIYSVKFEWVFNLLLKMEGGLVNLAEPRGGW